MRTLGRTLSVLVLIAFAAFSAEEINLSSGLTEKGAPLAAHGYDVVAFFTSNKPVLGVGKYSTAHNGATYRFSTAGNLKQFEANPEKYLPQYGGYCAFGVAVGAKFDGNPQLYKVVDGKLYFNLNQEIQDMWSKDVSGNIVKADKNWQRIASKPVKELKAQ